MPKTVKPWHPVIGSCCGEFFLCFGDALGAFAGDEEVFSITEFADLADLFTLLVVNTDFTPNIAWVLSIENHDWASLGEGVFDLVSPEIAFVTK